LEKGISAFGSKVISQQRDFALQLKACSRHCFTPAATMAAPGQDAKFFQRGKIEVCNAVLLR
jgi:hypothetical protein